MKYKLYDVVKLTVDLTDAPAGTTGTIVSIYDDVNVLVETDDAEMIDCDVEWLKKISIGSFKK